MLQHLRWSIPLYVLAMRPECLAWSLAQGAGLKRVRSAKQVVDARTVHAPHFRDACVPSIR